MKFKVNLVNQEDTSKIIEEETSAKNVKELKELYKIMYPGYQVNILESIGQPETVKNSIFKGGNKAAPPGYPSIPTVSQIPPIIQKPIEFEDNGIKYKIEKNVVYKKTWVPIKSKEYRIVTKSGKETENRDLTIEKLDWIKVNEEKKK